MTQPYTIKSVPHMNLFVHTLRIYQAPLRRVITDSPTPPADMTARMLLGNGEIVKPVIISTRRETRAATAAPGSIANYLNTAGPNLAWGDD